MSSFYINNERTILYKEVAGTDHHWIILEPIRKCFGGVGHWVRLQSDNYRQWEVAASVASFKISPFLSSVRQIPTDTDNQKNATYWVW